MRVLLVALLVAAPALAQTPDRLGDPEVDVVPEAAASAASVAPVPTESSFQGVLEDGGQPIADGTYDVVYRVYDVEIGGATLFVGLQSVTTEDGVFSFPLGGFAPSDEARWVEIEWEGTTLAPRTLIRPVPLARTLTAGANIRGDATRTLYVENYATRENAQGVLVDVRSPAGQAVRGRATSPTGQSFGGLFESSGDEGRGVFARSTSLSGETFGGRFLAESASGTAVFGRANATTGGTYGLWGEVRSSDGIAGYFRKNDLSLQNAAFLNEDVVVESADAVLGLYSDAGGLWGSAISLGEVDGAGALTTKWGIVRRTGSNASLNFTFGTGNNYVSNNTLMRIDANGTVRADGSFVGGGADLAEFFPLAPAASVRPGDLVGLRGGQVSLDTEAAEQVMIASSDPAFVGNPGTEAGGALVALVGQAEVRINGAASVGDLLVASGLDDGTARAVTPEAYRPEADGPVAGRVLSLPEAGRAVALVGVDEAAALRSVVQAQATRLDAQQAQIDALARRLDALTASGTAEAPSPPGGGAPDRKGAVRLPPSGRR